MGVSQLDFRGMMIGYTSANFIDKDHGVVIWSVIPSDTVM
jgi:hypothetical protein